MGVSISAEAVRHDVVAIRQCDDGPRHSSPGAPNRMDRDIPLPADAVKAQAYQRNSVLAISLATFTI